MNIEKYNKILFLTTSYPYDNVETFIDNEMKVLQSYCEEVIVVPMKTGGKDEFRDDCDVVGLNIGVFDYLKVLKKMVYSNELKEEIQLMKGRNALNIYTLMSIVYFYIKGEARIMKINSIIKTSLNDERNLIYAYWSGTTAYVAAGLKKLNSKCTCVARAHGYDIYQERLFPYYIPFKEKTFRVIDKIFSVSKCGYEYLKNEYPEIKEKFKLSYIGTYDNGVNPSVQGEKFKIVSCSDIIPVKRVDKIINALSRINSEIIWVHYGDGPQRKFIEGLAHKLGANIDYEFKGMVSNKELLKMYSKEHVDLFINVSESEGLPVSIMEAISFGIPVVASGVGGNPEIVISGFNGYLLSKVCSVDEIVIAIEKVIQLTERDMDEMRRNARRLWKEKFMAEKNYNKFFQSLL